MNKFIKVLRDYIYSKKEEIYDKKLLEDLVNYDPKRRKGSNIIDVLPNGLIELEDGWIWESCKIITVNSPLVNNDTIREVLKVSKVETEVYDTDYKKYIWVYKYYIYLKDSTGIKVGDILYPHNILIEK